MPGTTPSQFLNVYAAPGAPGTGLGTFPVAPSSPGALAGLSAYGGSPAAGRIPQVSDPTTTAAAALTGNQANMPYLSTLFNQVGATLVPQFTGLQELEAQNIADLLAGKFEVPEAFRRVAEMGTQMGPGGGESDAYKTAEILFGRRMAEEAKAMGAKRFSDAIARSRGVLDLEKFLQTPEQRQAWQWLADQLRAAPDPEEAFKRALSLIREGITRGFNTSRGPLGGGGGPTTLTNPSNTSSIIQRFGGPGQQSNPGTGTPSAGPGWGYLVPSGGGPGFGTTGGLPFTIPGSPGPGSTLTGPFSPASVLTGMPEGGYETPGDVPFWYQGDPEDLINPYI